MTWYRKSKTALDIEWNGRIYRRDPAHKDLHRQRYYMSTTHPRNFLHRDIYEQENGSIPEGAHVHHKDEDHNNNSPENLVAIVPSDHSKLHASKRKRFIKECDGCGKEYLATYERSRWCGAACKERIRRKNGTAYVKPKNPAQIISFKCQECGSKKTSTKKWAKFCCGKCRSASNKRKNRINGRK